MRFRYLNIILICSIVFSVVSVYGLKYRSQQIAKKNVSLARQIEQEKVLKSALNAKWALLNHPHIVEAIVARNQEVLKLQPIEVEQFAMLGDIPMRPETPDANVLGDLLMELEGDVRSVDIGLIDTLIEEIDQ